MIHLLVHYVQHEACDVSHHVLLYTISRRCGPPLSHTAHKNAAIGEVPRRPGQNPRRYRSPAEHQIPYETHMIRCADGITIHSWLLLHPHSREKKLPTILFFHGNAGNIGLRLPNAIQMFVSARGGFYFLFKDFCALLRPFANSSFV